MAKSNIITGLDIGSSSIKLIVVSPKAGTSKFEILSQISEPSFGVRRGVVINPEKVSQTISKILEKAEAEIGQKIDDVFINIGGSHIFTTSSHGTIAVSRADQKISREDVERVLQEAQTFSLPSNKEILKVFPKEFIVDGERGIKDVSGMEGVKGVRLETEILVLGCFAPFLKNLQKAVLEADCQISDIVCNPLGSAQAVLSPQEKELGVLLVEVGAGTTSFCVFSEGSLLALGIIPIGSEHITHDIAMGLKTDVQTAERIKLQFGSCFLKGGKQIKLKEKDSGESLVFSQKLLGEIVDSRVTEIFEQVQKELKKFSLPKLPAGVVLCGGGAKLPKIKEFAKKSFKLPCKLGKVSGFFPEIQDSQLSCACGLILEGKEDITEEESSTRRIFHKIKDFFKKILKLFIP